jgi:hypothetical protein
LKYSTIAKLEAQRVSLLHKLEKLSTEQSMFVENEGQWSVLEILEHLVLSEELSVNYAFKKIESPNTLRNVKWNTGLKVQLMRFVFILNFKYKAPKVVLPHTSKSPTFEELNQRWEDSRILLEELSNKSPGLLKKGVLNHPHVGFLNFKQMLVFIQSHYNHHLVQINHLVELQKEQVNLSEISNTANLTS